MQTLRERRLEGELMDDPQLDPQAHAQALRGLRRINRISRTVEVVWKPLERIMRANPDRALSVLDIATGGGDLPIGLCRKAQRRGLSLKVAGCDISAVAVGHARRAAAEVGVPARFFRTDVIGDGLSRHYDVVTCSLFLHHLSNENITALLRRLAECADHVLVSDLIRNWTGYGLAYAGTLALSRSPIVHIDGLRSVRAALTVPEIRALAAQAGLGGAWLSRRWPSRFLMQWQRDDARHQ